MHSLNKNCLLYKNAFVVCLFRYHITKGNIIASRKSQGPY